MIDFDIESFVRKYMTKRPESLLKADFEKYEKEMHERIDGKRMLVIGGAGTIGSNYVKAALRSFKPAAMYVVDIDENQLTELTRELRSGERRVEREFDVRGSRFDVRGLRSGGVEGEGYYVPAEYVTEPIDLGSKLFDKFFRAHGPFDIVANFAARKHVRAERDIHSIEAMCETNVFMAKKLLDLLVENPPETFFCVSTDKAANPVNVMGATKKLMEETIMAYASAARSQVSGSRFQVSGSRENVPGLKIVTARFANVAFSNGSLPLGWLNRIAKRQPMSCPMGIKRFFVSPVESGELCLAASVLAESGDIVYPKLDPERDMIPFDQVAHDFLNDIGFGCHDCSSSDEAKSYLASHLSQPSQPPQPSQPSQPPQPPQPSQPSSAFPWPCEFFASDTSGEKTFEEFYTDTDVKDETKFLNLGVVKNAKKPTIEEVEAIFAELHRVFDTEGSTKADVVAALGKYLGNFHHIEKGKSLDSRM